MTSSMAVAILTLLEAPVRAIAEGDTLHHPRGLRQADRDLQREVRQCRQLPGLSQHPRPGCGPALCHQDGGHEGTVL